MACGGGPQFGLPCRVLTPLQSGGLPPLRAGAFQLLSFPLTHNEMCSLVFSAQKEAAAFICFYTVR